MKNEFALGAIQSPPDHRDFMYAKLVPIGKQPKEFSLRTSLKTPVKDQGRFGSCVGQATAGAGETHYSNKNNEALSPLFIYSLCKTLDGIPNQEGTYPKIAMQVLQKYGVCKEATFPYSQLVQPTTFPQPTSVAKAMTEALNFRTSAYAKVSTMAEAKQALLTDGGVLCSVGVYENFFSPEGGKFIPMPQGNFAGNHAMVKTGYDDDMTYTYKNGRTYVGFFEFRNSWGPSWGDQGYCYIPYAFFTERSSTGVAYWVESWSSVDVLLPPVGASLITLELDSPIAIVDGKVVQLDRPAFVDPKSGRTVVPLRFLSENMGYKVRWDGDHKIVTLSK